MKTEVYFGDRSKEWTSLYQNDRRFARRLRRIASLIDKYVPPRALVLDAGCGSGVFSRYLAEKGRTVTAFDASSSMIDAAQSQATPVVRYFTSDLESFTTGERFDAVVSFSMIEYIDDDRAALRKLAGLLDAGGVMIVSVPNRGGLRMIESIIFGIRKISGDKLFRGRGEYLNYQKHQYTSVALDRLLTEQGMVKLDGIYLNAGFELPSFLYSLFERSWWAAMYCGVYKKRKTLTEA